MRVHHVRIHVTVRTTRTGVGGVALGGAGDGGDDGVVVVAECRDLLVGGVVTAGAGVVGIPTDGGTRRGLCVVVHEVVAECRDLRIGGVVAPRAGIVGVPTDGCAGGRLRGVLHEVVPQCIHVRIYIVMRATRAGVRGVALVGAGGRGDDVVVVVAECRDLLVGGVVTAGAGVVGVPTDGGTSGRLRVVVHDVMAEGVYVRIHVTVRTTRTGVRGVAL